jgi:hypothetical protein
MSTQPIASYSFLPWARQGLGTNVNEGDQDAAVKVRASVDLTLGITGEQIAGGTVTQTVPRTVQLYGPGDVIGVDQKIIVRTEPRNWITNFENNYLPFIEFYEEDFPWRYTPAKSTPDGKRVRPWLALLVLEEGEFTDGKNVLGRPLPFIEVENADQVFPPFDDLWAWAHVHVNGGMNVDPNDTAALANLLAQTLEADRDLAYSRVLSPRILKPNTGYHAFLIPSFETGRLAGLGKDPAGSPFATQSAWGSYPGRDADPDAKRYPFYFRWYFRTGTVGDFEYLVRLLQPRTVDPRVGRRDFDVQKPDLNLPGIMGLGGILRLGGALRPPLSTLSAADLAEYTRFENWGQPYPHPFQTALAALVNLAQDYADQSALDANNGSGLGSTVAGDEDPLIVPPIYGRWHAQVNRLVPAGGDPAKRMWVHELNLDPRHRVAAGFGTGVIQQNQENYMEAAWQQVGKVLEGNHRIRLAQMARLASVVWHTRELTPVQLGSPERFLALAAPLQRRVLAGGFTLHHQVRQSSLPAVLTGTTMRRALRPGGRVSRLVGFDAARNKGNLISRVNSGSVSAAPPKVVPAILPTEEKIADDLAPTGLPGGLLTFLENYPWLRFLPILIAVLVVALLFIFASPVVALAAVAFLIAGGIWGATRLGAILSRARAADTLRPDTRTPASVDLLPRSPDFRIGTPGVDPLPGAGATDSVEAVRFKESLRNLYTVDAAERTIKVPVRQPLAIAEVSLAAIVALHPDRTIVPRVLGSILIPDRIRGQLVDPFGEVMVYPGIDLPMYEPLKDTSTELFLPNVQLVSNNSITLLEANQKFIEAYMVGLNHEFARELLWRQYPTDQRGSYFRQFWDVRGYLSPTPTDPAVLRERLFDIPELHRWDVNTGLGEHDNRKASGDKESELVLVIRGELLKKYPTAVIYAHRAAWERTGTNAIDKSRPRKLAPLTPGQESNPPRDIVKTPLYEAKIDPDIYFFGFDLTAEQARGGQIVNGEEDPGWFFVIKERPGEPRFGLDIPQGQAQPVVHTWSDLAWTDVLNTVTPGEFLRLGERTVVLTDPGPGTDESDQYAEDSRFEWRADTHAAELAYILFQLPVLMAVHASEMLKKDQ